MSNQHFVPRGGRSHEDILTTSNNSDVRANDNANTYNDMYLSQSRGVFGGNGMNYSAMRHYRNENQQLGTIGHGSIGSNGMHQANNDVYNNNDMKSSVSIQSRPHQLLPLGESRGKWVTLDEQEQLHGSPLPMNLSNMTPNSNIFRSESEPVVHS